MDEWFVRLPGGTFHEAHFKGTLQECREHVAHLNAARLDYLADT